MKKSFPFLIIFLFILASAIAQKSTIQLKFSGLLFGQHVNMDSIHVKNVTHNCDTILFWPDTILTLLYGVGINENPEINTGFTLFQNVPNPIASASTIDLYLPGKSDLEVSISDVSGRLILSDIYHLNSGSQRFNFVPGGEKIYLFSAKWKGILKTIRILNENQHSSSNCQLSYSGAIGTVRSPKSISSTNPFTFGLGNVLKISGHAGAETSSFLCTPYINTNYKIFFGMNYPCPGQATFNYGGQLYNTLQIGSQCWMKENLNLGTMVTSVSTGSIHSECINNLVIEKYCLNNIPAMCDTFGGLYDWEEMMQYIPTPGSQGICPTGWHIPTDDEWCTLETFLDPTVTCGIWAFLGTDVAGKMKEAGTAHWAAPNAGATNQSGFTALPSGFRWETGQFVGYNIETGFWSSSVYQSINGIYQYITWDHTSINRNTNDKHNAFSVRCLKN